MLGTLLIKNPQKTTPRLRRYLLRDPFGDAIAAGAVNNTPATIGGLRTGVDTENKLSVIDGAYSFSGGKATPAFGDPAFSYQATPHARTFGCVMIFKGVTIATFADGIIGLFPIGALGVNDAHGFRLASTSLGIREAGAFSNLIVATLSAGVSYDLAIIERAAGAFFFIKGGAFSTYRLLGITAVNGLANLVVGISNKATVFTGTDIITPSRLYNIAPLASDSFTIQATTDGQGHAEQNGGAGLTWLDAANTWAVAGGAVSNTPSVGAELVTNGNMETGDPPSSWASGASGVLDGVADERTGGSGTQSMSVVNGAVSAGRCQQSFPQPSGTWILFSGWGRRAVGINNPVLRVRNTNGGTIAYAITLATTTSWTFGVMTARLLTGTSFLGVEASSSTASDEFRADDVSGTALTLSTLFRSLLLSTPDVYRRARVVSLTAGTQAGIVIRLDSAATPTQGIIVYFDGAGNIGCEEFTGTTTYTALFTAVVKAFTASDSLIVHAMGTAIRIYHETAAGVQTLIGTGTTTVTTGNLHGIFSTFSGNTLDNLVTYPIGTEGQWESLNSM